VRLRQILANLIGNAIKFTEIGGVTLLVGLDGGGAQGDPLLRFEVRDTGIGVPEDHMGRLFGAFTQADASTTRKFGGTGLGLRISKRLAEMLGGDITVTSRVGGGSIFTATVATGRLDGVLLIDMERAREARATPAAQTVHSTAPLKGVRILLVEDGPDNQRLIGFHLKKAGAAVTIAENGLRAVQLLCANGEASGPLFPTLPVRRGADGHADASDGWLLGHQDPSRERAQLAQERPSPPTPWRAKNDKCLHAGCDGYLTKPIERDVLIEACERAAAAGLQLSA